MDFRIITVGTRPKREVLLARAVSEEGTNIVEVRTYAPRNDNPDEDWEFAGVIDFGRDMGRLRAYIRDYTEQSARDFVRSAQAEAKRNTDEPDRPAPAPTT